MFFKGSSINLERYLMNKFSAYLLLALILIGFLNIEVYSQEVWSLDKCMAHSDTANLNLQKKRIDLTISEVNRSQANLNMLPSLNLGGTHGFNWGQSIDPFTNQFATDRVRTNNLYASSNWKIFSGLENYYLRNESELDYKRIERELEIESRNLKMNIAAAYMQAVLNDYLIGATKRQVEYAVRSKDLIKEKYELEYVTKYDLLAMTSQLAIDSMKLIRAENNKKYSLLLLKQLLNLDQEIQIEIPDIETLQKIELEEPNFDVSSSPEYKLTQLNIDIQRTRLKKSRAGLMPTAAINGSLGSGYSGNNTILVGSEFLPKPFNVQMEENFYQSAVLTVNVPVFNRGRVRTDMKLAEAEIKKSQIDQEIMLQQLIDRYDKLNNEISNERLNVTALRKALDATEKRFEAAQIKYDAGSMNVKDYLDLRNELFKTRSEYYTSMIKLRFKEKIRSYLLE